MWALDFLDLDINADDKAIKRAYAKQLKITRPDENPVAFQQLNEAYQAALDWYKSSQQQEDASEKYDEVSIKTSSVDISSAPYSFDTLPIEQNTPLNQNSYYYNQQTSSPNFLDTNRFCQQCIAVAQQNNPEKLKHWLNTQQELWSLNNKQILMESLISTLLENPVGIHKDCFLVISKFFDLDTVQNTIDYQTISNLENHLNALWLIDPKNIAQLKQDHKHHPRFSNHRPDINDNWPLLEQLHKPFSWLQAGFASIPISRAKHWDNSLSQLLQNLDYTVPNTIDPKQLKFWLSFNKVGLQAAKMLHWTIVTLIVFLVTLYPFCLLVTSNISSSGSSESIIGSLCLLPGFAFVISAFALGILIFLWYCLWLKTPYYAINNFYLRIFSIFWTPSLCLISIPLFLWSNNHYLFFILLALFNVACKITIKIQQRFEIPPGFFIIAYFSFGIISAIFNDKKNTTSASHVNIFSTITFGLPINFIYFVGLIVILVIWLSDFLSQKENHDQKAV